MTTANLTDKLLTELNGLQDDTITPKRGMAVAKVAQTVINVEKLKIDRAKATGKQSSLEDFKLGTK